MRRLIGSVLLLMACGAPPKTIAPTTTPDRPPVESADAAPAPAATPEPAAVALPADPTLRQARLEALIEADSDSPAALTERGRLHASLGMIDEAAEVLLRVADHPAARRSLRRLVQDHGRWRVWLEVVARRPPVGADEALLTVLANAGQGAIDAARDALTERLRATPGEPRVMGALAAVELMAGRPVVAEALARSAARRGDLRFAARVAAVASSMRGADERADEAFTRLLEPDPTDPVAVDYAHHLLISLRPAEAIPVLERRLAHAPLDARAARLAIAARALRERLALQEDP